MKNIEYLCQMEILSPLHVGNGKQFHRGIDFDLSGNKLVVYDSAKVHARLAQAGKAVMEKYEKELLNDRPSMQNFFRAMGWKDDEYVLYRLNVSTHNIRDIKAQVKTGLGQPIVPGSSIKGALRTAMLANFVDEHPDLQGHLVNLRNPDKKKKQFAARRITERVFGKDPNHNVLRLLNCGDVTFERNHLNIQEAKIVNLTQNGFGFLVAGREKRNVPPEKWRDGTSILMETLKTGALSQPFTIDFDDFLNDHLSELFKDLKIKPDPIPLSGKFFGVVEWHFKLLAEREYNFFKENNITQAASFYEKQILNRTFGDDQVLMRIGWGGGWKFMTGDWLNEEQLEIIRREYHLSRREFKIFPKSRRLLVDANYPKIPPGWVVLRLLNT